MDPKLHHQCMNLGFVPFWTGLNDRTSDLYWRCTNESCFIMWQRWAWDLGQHHYIWLTSRLCLTLHLREATSDGWISSSWVQHFGLNIEKLLSTSFKEFLFYCRQLKWLVCLTGQRQLITGAISWLFNKPTVRQTTFEQQSEKMSSDREVSENTESILIYLCYFVFSIVVLTSLKLVYLHKVVKFNLVIDNWYNKRKRTADQ